MRQKGGSSISQIFKPTPVLRNQYETDIATGVQATNAQESAAVALKNAACKQQQINGKSCQMGGAVPPSKCDYQILDFQDGVATNSDNQILIPQFDEFNPVSPVNGNSASVINNKISVTNQANSIYDHFAFTGGKKLRKTKTKRKRKTHRGRRAGNDKRAEAIKKITRAVRARKTRHLAKRMAAEDMDSPRSPDNSRLPSEPVSDPEADYDENFLIRRMSQADMRPSPIKYGGKKSKKKHQKLKKSRKHKKSKKSRKRKSRKSRR